MASTVSVSPKTLFLMMALCCSMRVSSGTSSSFVQPPVTTKPLSAVNGKKGIQSKLKQWIISNYFFLEVTISSRKTFRSKQCKHHFLQHISSQNVMKFRHIFVKIVANTYTFDGKYRTLPTLLTTFWRMPEVRAVQKLESQVEKGWKNHKCANLVNLEKCCKIQL